MNRYLDGLLNNRSFAFIFIKDCISEFSQKELTAIIRAFDYVTEYESPRILKSGGGIDEVYAVICNSIRNELLTRN